MIRSGCWAIAVAGLALTAGVGAQTIQPYAGGAPHPGQSYAAGALSLELDFVDRPVVITSDAKGNIFLATGFSPIGEEPSTIFELTPAGQLLRYAGNGVQGDSGDGGPATAAEFDLITGLAAAPNGDLYVADTASGVIRKVSAATGLVSTVAGTAGVSGYSGDGGLATAATLSLPDELGVDLAGDLYIADRGNCALREVNASSGVIRTIASLCAGVSSDPSRTDFAVAPQGDVYVTDPAANAIWRIDAHTGVTTRFAGAPAGDATACAPSATASCPAQNTNFYPMGDLGVDAAGEVFILAGGLAAGPHLPAVEKIADGTVSTFMVGHGLCYPNCVPVPALGQTAPALDLAVAFGTLWVTPTGTMWAYDAAERQLLAVDTQTGVATTMAGNGQVADSGDGGPPLEAQVHADGGLALGPHGELYAIDQADDVVRAITPDSIRRVAGHANGFGNRYTGPVPATQFNLPAPNGIAVDSAGNLFISDSTGYVWRVDAATGILTDYAWIRGANSITIDRDDTLYVCSSDHPVKILGDGTQQEIPYCGGAVDADGNIYAISDNTVEEWVKATGTVRTIAGNGTWGFSGDDGPATAAELRNPTQVGVDGARNVFIAGSNGFIREVYAATGTIRTIAGNGTNGQPDFTGPAAGSAFPGTHVMAVDAAGDVFVSTAPNEIREIKTTPALSLSATALDFGTVVLPASPAAQTLTLTNTGGVPLSLANFSVAGVNASDFSLGSGCQLPIPPGASCALSVTFAPAAAGARSAQLDFTDNTGSGGATVPLTGTGVVLTAQVSPSQLDFGPERTATSSPARTLTLTNTGSADLAIASIAVGGGDFQQTNTCGATLAAGAACTIAVTFRPGSEGTLTATLTINDNAADSPQSAVLTGTGTAPAASLSAAALTFAPALIGTSSAAQSVTLSNSGTAGMSLTTVKTSGDFKASSSCGTVLAAGASCAIQVSFTPAAAGARSGTLTITGDAETQSVTLAGTGQDFSLATTGPTASAIAAGQTTQYQLQLLSAGGFTAPVTLACAVSPSPNPLACHVPATVEASGSEPLPIPVTVTAAASSGTVPIGRGPAGLVWLLLGAAFLWRELGEATSRAGLPCRPSKPAAERPAGATQHKAACRLPATAVQRRRFATAALGALALLLAACGGTAAGSGASGALPAKSQNSTAAYTLTVTATSGPLTRSTQLTVTLR